MSNNLRVLINDFIDVLDGELESNSEINKSNIAGENGLDILNGFKEKNNLKRDYLKKLDNENLLRLMTSMYIGRNYFSNIDVKNNLTEDYKIDLYNSELKKHRQVDIESMYNVGSISKKENNVLKEYFKNFLDNYEDTVDKL
ncbi:hypothetical protein CW676_02035 [Macrococcoides caseolyticum]|uniref:hypothetical protein n=1 Tax=Macrococcoides caseolyticum TaxID=69966 RepID=UPI000C339394|nr:hypothetical protein [Macrococcus caseolyticus]PKE07296.1 hypothetical protein CW692_03265 [Macrococcus caseolyticus]PKE54037.1 hypothetical protein CW676_02035 [Macrococcus caseolyticus]PKF39120.1 hypothetical protein CW681_02365 [Macrococcus caseolyticus]